MLIGCSVTSDTIGRTVENLTFVSGIRRCADEVHVLLACPFEIEPQLQEEFRMLRHGFKSFDILPCQNHVPENRRWQHIFHHSMLRNVELPKLMVLLPTDCIPVKANWVDMLTVASGPNFKGLSSKEVATNCMVFPTMFYADNDAINYIGIRKQELHEYLATTVEYNFLHPLSISNVNRDTTAILVGDEQVRSFILEYGPESLPEGELVDPSRKDSDLPTPNPVDVLSLEDAKRLLHTPLSVPVEEYLAQCDARQARIEEEWKVPKTMAEMPLVDEKFGDLVVDKETEAAFGEQGTRGYLGGFPMDIEPEEPEITPMNVVQFGSSEESPNPQHRWYVIEIFEADADTRAQPRSREEILCNHTTVQAAVSGYIRYAGVKAMAYDRETGLTVNSIGFRTDTDKKKKRHRKLEFRDLLHIPLHKMEWNELLYGLYRPLTRYFGQKWQMVTREELEPIVDRLRRDYIKIAVEAREDNKIGVVR